MRFEKFLLSDYMQTEEGKKIVSFFQNFRHIFFHDQPQLFQFVNHLLDIPEAENFFSIQQNFDVDDPEDESLFIESGVKSSSLDDFIEYYSHDQYFLEESRNFQSLIPFFSVCYSFEQPEYAFPYLFPVHFHRFTEICENFGITLPKLPGPTQHLERILYYFELCRTMYEFRKQHDLTSFELCVFLYGFAPRFFTKFIEQELPPPNRIYIAGATKGDAMSFMKKNPEENDIRYWQGNEETLPGDIIILYETTPYSRIGYIWRAVSNGYDDPFHYFPGKILVSHPVKIPYIYFNTLQNDPVWSKKGLVKAHMQGVNGRPVSLEEYEALKLLIKKQVPSFDLSKLPEPPAYAQIYHEELQYEEDVEKQLLEPFLTKIGYNVVSEFTRRFPIRMGRGIRYYPDYALHASGERGHEKADFVWEAKLRIPTNKQLAEDFGQAKSYAKCLQTKGLGLVSMEGIWLSFAEDHFDLEKIRKYSWAELEESDIFGNVKILLLSHCKPAGKTKLR